MAANPADDLLATAERELEESIAALNDLFEHNFIYLIPKQKDSNKSSQPQAIDVTQMIMLSDKEQSKITTKLREILPKLSKVRRNNDGNSDNIPRARMSNFDELINEADDAFEDVSTRTPNSSIFSNNGQAPSDAERRFTEYFHRASVAFENYEKSEYNDDSSKQEFKTFIKDAKKTLNQLNKNEMKTNESNSNLTSMFDEFDTLMEQADTMYDSSEEQQTQDDEKSNNNNNNGKVRGSVADAHKGISKSLAIINEQLKLAAINNEKVIQTQNESK